MGRISAAQFRAVHMTSSHFTTVASLNNLNYVPFHRVVERLEDGGGQGQAIGARLTGGDCNTRDIAENIVEGLASNIRAATIAWAKQTLYRDIMGHPSCRRCQR